MWTGREGGLALVGGLEGVVGIRVVSVLWGVGGLRGVSGQFGYLTKVLYDSVLL